MKLEGIIFDWAGTTVDFGCFAPVRAFEEAFQVYGILPETEEIRKPMGMLKRDHVEAMLQMERIGRLWLEKYGTEYKEKDIDAIYRESEKRILRAISHYATPNPYVTDTVDLLRKRGVKIGSTTGYTRDMMEVLVPLAQEQGYRVDYWVSAETVGNYGRPYPYMIFRNMEKLGMSSVQRVMKIGDTKADIEEGKAAGVITVGVIEGSSEMGLSKEEYREMSEPVKKGKCREVRERFFSYGADYVINNFTELLPLIDRLV